MDMFDTVAASEKGAWLHLTNIATGLPAYADDAEKKPIRIHLMGSDSKEVRQRVKKRAAVMVKRRGTKMDVSRMSEGEIMALMADGEKSKLGDAVDATFGWENLSRDGKPLDFSAENAEWLYSRYPAIMREVLAFLEGEANFFEKA